MSDTTREPSKKPFLVELDDEVVTWPGRSLNSMLEIFSHLEHLASRRGRERRRPRNPAEAAEAASSPAGGMEESAVSFRELGRQVIRSANAQVAALQTRAQEAQSLVLINNWVVAERLWQGLLAECKTPLLELNFLEELWGIRAGPQAGGWLLAPHWHQFVLIQAEIEILLSRRENLAELSDAFGKHLGHWLQRFEGILERLDEESAR